METRATVESNHEAGLRALPELEQIVESGLRVFLDVARALLEIHERRLYLEAGYTNLGSYARARWDIAPSTAYRHVNVAKVVQILSSIEDIQLPANEAQARELIPLVDNPDALREVWREATSTGKSTVTAREIHALAVKRTGLEPTQRTPAATAADLICPHCGLRWD